MRSGRKRIAPTVIKHVHKRQHGSRGYKRIKKGHGRYAHGLGKRGQDKIRSKELISDSDTDSDSDAGGNRRCVFVRDGVVNNLLIIHWT